MNVLSSERITEIYNRHINTVYRVCYIYMKNKHDAEDCVEDVFCRMIQHEKFFESEEHEKAWLIRVAENVCKNLLKRTYRKDINIEDIQEEKSEQYFDETIKHVLELPAKYKIPIYLHYYEGYTCKEISKIQKCTESTIRSQLLRGRNLLKDVLTADIT